jgi:hypothetical protein
VSTSNRRVSPYGTSTPFMAQRLKAPPGTSEPEKAVASAWDRRNVREQSDTLVPLDMIAHQCGPDCKGDSHREYPQRHDTRNVAIAAATIQWLVTPDGQDFLTLELIPLLGPHFAGRIRDPEELARQIS